MTQGVELYPLRFRCDVREKVWGGRNLASRLNKQLPEDTAIGESWEAGGEAVVDNGPYAGRTLDSLVAELGPALVGTQAKHGIFPLLYKYIDASEFLSVQVHPDDAYAQEYLNYPYGKTEAWYIVHADPGARIVHGWKRDTSEAEVRAAVEQDRLEELLEYVEVEPGDVIYTPAGIVHALGGGVVLGEIQENSDITFRLYDWGRMGLDGKPRDLHVEESLRVLDYHATREHKIAPLAIQEDGLIRKFLVACDHFAVELLEGSEPPGRRTEGKFDLLSLLEGQIGIEWQGGTLDIRSGETILVPAALGDWRLRPSEPYQLLRMYVPDLELDVVQPLRHADYSDEEIARLGGDRGHNDLLEALG